MVNLRMLENSESDYQLLYKWYQNEKVMTYFEQRSLSYQEIVNKYSKRTLVKSITPVYMIEYNNLPVGIIQYTKLTKETKNKYHVTNDGYDVDVFIGEDNYYHKGIGSLAIKELIKMLKNEGNIIVMVPEVNNINAIKCYQKVGFKKKYFYTEPDTIGVDKEKVVMIYE